MMKDEYMLKTNTQRAVERNRWVSLRSPIYSSKVKKMFARSHFLTIESLTFFMASIISASQDDFGIGMFIPAGLYFALPRDRRHLASQLENAKHFLLGWLLGASIRLGNFVQEQLALSADHSKPSCTSSLNRLLGLAKSALPTYNVIFPVNDHTTNKICTSIS